jgi:hypothetical protein
LDRSLQQIRDLLEVRPTVDHERLAQVAASIDNLAGHLEQDMRTAISSRPQGYPAQFRTQSLSAAQEFRAAARQLNEMFAAGERPGRIHDATTRVAERWNTVVPFLDRFTGPDRDHLLVVRQQIAPGIIELQTGLHTP